MSEDSDGLFVVQDCNKGNDEGLRFRCSGERGGRNSCSELNPWEFAALFLPMFLHDQIEVVCMIDEKPQPGASNIELKCQYSYAAICRQQIINRQK